LGRKEDTGPTPNNKPCHLDYDICEFWIGFYIWGSNSTGSFIIFSIIWNLVSANTVCTLGTYPFCTSIAFFVKVFEERELEFRFGASYLEYKFKTPMLFPRKPGKSLTSD
jgi:hypothetical protein